MGKTEIAVKIKDYYVTVQESDYGWDYSIYDKCYKLFDGGILESFDYNIYEVLLEIVSSETVLCETLEIVDGDVTRFPELDYDEFEMMVE